MTAKFWPARGKKKSNSFYNKHQVGVLDKLVQHILCQLIGQTVRPIFLSANHDYEAAPDDLWVFNPNRFSNNFGAIGGRFMGWGAIKFTIFSWTLYLQHQIIQKLIQVIWLMQEIDCYNSRKRKISSSYLSIPYLATFWGTSINNFSFLCLHSLQRIKCFLYTNRNSR